MTDRVPVSPLRSQASHALKVMTLAISIVMATGAVAASSTTDAPSASPAAGRTTTAALNLVASTGTDDDPALVVPAGTIAPAPAIAPPGPVLATVATRAARVIYHGSRARKVIALT